MNEQIINQLNRIEKLLIAQKPKPFTALETSKYLNISMSYLYKLTHLRKIPFYKPFGKHLFFDKESQDELIYKNRVNSQDELDQEVEAYVRKNPIRNILNKNHY